MQYDVVMTSADNTNPSRKRRWLKVLVIDVVIFLVVYMAAQWWLGRGAPSGLATDFVAVDTQGKRIVLADYRGKPLLLHFWASWCGICRFEHGSIDNIAADHAVITVMTRSGSEDEARHYLHENDISARVILDEDGELADSYRVRGVPASFIINANGEIADVEIGYSSELGLRARLWLAGW